MPKDFAVLVEKVYGAWKKKNTGFVSACPGEESLALLSQGLLVGKEAARVRAHIVRCPHCAEDFSMAIRVSSAPEVAVPGNLLSGIRERSGKGVSVMHVVLHLAGSALEIVKTTGEIITATVGTPVGVMRGGTSGVQKEITIREDFRSLQIELSIENKGTGFFTLTVCAWKKEKILRGIRYTLMKEGVELESYRTDKGTVVFEHVTSGFYVVYLTAHDKLVSKITLDVVQ
ncbi:MAG TPA: hypothetical protein PKL77_06535 [Candidatus Omnitrophota bacterium]|nr:hypothetical protein [Candidatus Omnitrophota bacterium]HPT07922.1 hypothetical protein [Candidatus Omnitrophota bacterium]